VVLFSILSASRWSRRRAGFCCGRRFGCPVQVALSRALRPWRTDRAVHDPAKMLIDVATAVVLGGDCLADVAVVRAQPEVFGPVASDGVPAGRGLGRGHRCVIAGDPVGARVRTSAIQCG
jgi:hypothetical protein